MSCFDVAAVLSESPCSWKEGLVRCLELFAGGNPFRYARSVFSPSLKEDQHHQDNPHSIPPMHTPRKQTIQHPHITTRPPTIPQPDPRTSILPRKQHTPISPPPTTTPSPAASRPPPPPTPAHLAEISSAAGTLLLPSRRYASQCRTRWARLSSRRETVFLLLLAQVVRGLRRCVGRGRAMRVARYIGF